ncbi:MAG TPA: hypothetical protein DHW02_16035 [Ktedonobacter sp.]|nr:hypothetical protein [Ktedonobacter sp.]
MSLQTTNMASSTLVTTSPLTTFSPRWSRQFTFCDRQFYYNRIPYNNWSERAVEVPLAFDFLARHQAERMLEVGNVLQHYENELSDALGMRNRCIVDKFEVGAGISNVDILAMDSKDTYQAILSISTIEHVGQQVSPDGHYGEDHNCCDSEGPLKAVAKIYDMLAPEGHALITTPFGILTDGGWYVQSSYEYLDLLITKYGIPREALSLHFMKSVAFEWKLRNPRQQWVEAEAKELAHTRYDGWRGGARAIAVIEMTKLTQPFSLQLDVPPTPLTYHRSWISKCMSCVASVFH